MQGPLHKQVRTALSARIARGELGRGERLPAERALAEQFGVARSVIRQALAGLARDGLVVSAYPRGYLVLGPRIPWLSRLRLLSEEPWDVEVISVREVPASPRDATTLRIDVGDPIAESVHELRGVHSGEPWGLGLSRYPLDGLDAPARALLLRPDILDDDDVERAYSRRIVGYHERISARPPTRREQTSLDIGPIEPVLVVARTSRTTTNPISTSRSSAAATASKSTTSSTRDPALRAGKRRSGKTSKGSKWLSQTLVECAKSANHGKNTYLAAHYARLCAGRGANKATIAVCHST